MPGEPRHPVGVNVVRLLLASTSAALALAVLAVVAVAAPGAIADAASPNAGAATAQYCPPAEVARRKALVKRYQRQMPAAKKAFFRKTRSAKARQSFVKKQTAQLKALQRAVKACD